MSLEFHIPISPTPHFFHAIWVIAASLRDFGGEAAEAMIHVSVGEDVEPWDIAQVLPWSRHYPVEWHWVPREDFQRRSYYATSAARYRWGFEADRIIFLDADTLFLRPIDDLLAEATRSDMIGGLIAHASPFRTLPQRGQREWWDHLNAGLGLGRAFLGYEHSGWGLFGEDAQYRTTPTYFNYGMVIGTNAVMREIAAVMDPLATYCLGQGCGFFSSQVALALAIQKIGAPARPLPFRFNCSNWGVFEGKFAAEIADARLAHFHETSVVNRHADFQSLGTLSALVNRPGLLGVNAQIQARIAALLPGIAEVR